jgi:hypothetical protein
MRHRVSGAFLAVVLFGSCAVMSSCGGASGSTANAEPKSTSPAVARAAEAEKPEQPFVPPTVSIGGETRVAAVELEEADADSKDLDSLPEPEKGTPEWLIREITRLNSAPIDIVTKEARRADHRARTRGLLEVQG